MAKFRILALFAVLVSSAQLSAGSILSVKGGVYSRVTARIDADAVPRQHCKRAIKNLQVSIPTCPASVLRPPLRLVQPHYSLLASDSGFRDCNMSCLGVKN